MILRGGSRSSKTHSTLQALWLKASTTKNLVVVMGAITMGVTTKNLITPLRKIAAHQWEAKNFGKQESVYRFDNGSIIYFISMDTEDKVVGLASDYVFLDEANLSRYAGPIIMQLATRMRKSMILAFNPSRRPEWLVELEERKDSISLHSTYLDNEYLEQTVIDEIETRAKIDPYYDAVYRRGIYMVARKLLVFHNWGISDKWPEKFDWELYGADWGFAADPTTLVHVRYADGELWARELLYETELDTMGIYNSIYDKVRLRAPIVGDNSELRLISELQSKGLNIFATRKYPGSIIDGIRLMQGVRINVHSDSSNLKRELESYLWKEVGGVVIDAPADRQADHLLDAMRYVVLDKLRLSVNKYSFG